MHHSFLRFEPVRARSSTANQGVLISLETGPVTTHASS
jgi:predicted membrane GTPase involved in stress response